MDKKLASAVWAGYSLYFGYIAYDAIRLHRGQRPGLSEVLNVSEFASKYLT